VAAEAELTRPAAWVRYVLFSALVGFLAIPLHELGHVIGYRLLGVAATMSYAREIVPPGEPERFLGVAGGPLLTTLVCFGAIALVYRRKWLPASYAVAVIASLDRIILYGMQWRQLLVLHRVSPGMDESRMAALIGASPFFWYVVFTLACVVAWTLIVRSLSYGRLKSALVCVIPVAMFVAGAAIGVFVIERLVFPQQFHTQFGSAAPTRCAGEAA
jgi:hypothetical protein